MIKLLVKLPPDWSYVPTTHYPGSWTIEVLEVLYFGVISLFSFPHPGKLWRFSCIFLFVDKYYAGQVSGAQLTGLDGAGRSHEVKIQYGDFGQASSEVRQLCSGTTLGLN